MVIEMKKIAVLNGSIAAKSVNLTLLRALEKLANGRLQFDYVDIASLPHYDNDLWDNPPSAVTKLKHQIEAADGVLIAVPEYNRSFPGVLKNALDWASRPYGQSSWADKPVATVGATPGATGTAAGQGHLRAILPVYGMVVMGQPEVYLNMKPGLIDENFEITDETTQAFLGGFVDRFTRFVDLYGSAQTAVAAE